jgi:hypothetical protein
MAGGERWEKRATIDDDDHEGDAFMYDRRSRKLIAQSSEGAD